jgi:hypothetical protein
MSDRRLRDAISNALEAELIDCGITADSELEKIFERIRRILVPNMPWREFELRVADLRNELEPTLARYVLLNVKSAANAVLDALEEVEERREEKNKEVTKTTTTSNEGEDQ